jgi:hypothetical protein
MYAARIAALHARLVFVGGNHFLVGLNPFFTINREWIWPGVRRQRCRVDGQRLVFIFEVEIPGQSAPVDRIAGRFVSAIFLQLDIPPPLLDIVQATISEGVIELCQQRRGLGNVHGRPAERGLCK